MTAISYEIVEKTTENGISSELLLRTTQRTDGAVYKCEAKNDHGVDERTTKLVVVGMFDQSLRSEQSTQCCLYQRCRALHKTCA